MKQFITGAWDIWKDVCTITVTSIWVLVIIFGGSWHLQITFHTIKGLIKAIKNYFS